MKTTMGIPSRSITEAIKRIQDANRTKIKPSRDDNHFILVSDKFNKKQE